MSGFGSVSLETGGDLFGYFSLQIKFGSNYYSVNFAKAKPWKIANFLDPLYVMGDLEVAVDANSLADTWSLGL